MPTSWLGCSVAVYESCAGVDGTVNTPSCCACSCVSERLVGPASVVIVLDESSTNDTVCVACKWGRAKVIGPLPTTGPGVAGVGPRIGRGLGDPDTIYGGSLA